MFDHLGVHLTINLIGNEIIGGLLLGLNTLGEVHLKVTF
jgi:hypothetical protein